MLTPCERDMITDCKLSELASLFPDEPLVDLKAERARMKKRRQMQAYRKRYYCAAEPAPPGSCMEYERSIQAARIASGQLLRAILRSGLRP
jgi:hypothetical protein